MPGGSVPDGTYTSASRRSTWPATPVGAQRADVIVVGALRTVTTRRPLFFPQDLDALARSDDAVVHASPAR